MASRFFKYGGLFLLIIGLIVGVPAIISSIISNLTYTYGQYGLNEMLYGVMWLWGIIVLLVFALPGYAYFRIGQRKQEVNKLITTGLWLKLISIIGCFSLLAVALLVLMINPSPGNVPGGLIFANISIVLAVSALALYGLGLLLLIIGKIRR